MKKKLVVLSVFFVFIDQFLKTMISGALELNRVVEMIPNFFYITHVHNEGAAWSMLEGNTVLLILIAIGALVGIYFSFIYQQKINHGEMLIYSLLIGGIIGNLLDRILFGYVIDYLGFIIFGYYFPIFNFADTAIVISIIGLAFLMLKEELSCKKSA